MGDTMLFVFEGETIETQIFNSIEANFFSSPDSRTAVKSFFCGDILQLWKKVRNDPYLDIVEVLKERPSSSIGSLKRSDVSEVHLFFDHDGHSRPDMPPEEYHGQIIDLLDTFSDEHEMGKLWISYPMAEAIRNCKKNPSECFSDAHLKICDNVNYKNFVHRNSDYADIRKYDKPVWYYMCAINTQRAHCIVSDTYKAIFDYGEINGWFEGKPSIVKMIHEKQFDKFIKPKSGVVALSPFPLFLLYYFGRPFFNECKCDETEKTCYFSCYH